MKRAAVLCLLAATGCTNFELLGQLKPRKVVLRTNDAIALADGGTLLQPRPKAGLKPCIAWVDVELTKQWQKVEGEWTADGECTLHNVPPGELLLNRGQPDSVVYLSTNLDEIDLGLDYIGRPFSYAGPKTTLTVDLSRTAPLATFNMVSMYLPDFGTGLINLSGGGAAGVGVPTGMLGATSFPASFDFDGLPLVKSNESIDIFQGTPLTAGSISFRLTKRATVKANLVDAQNVRTSAVMEDLTTNAATGFSAFSFLPQTFYSAVEADIVEPEHVGIGVFQEAVLNNTDVPLSVQTTYLFGDKTGALTATAVSVDPFPGRAWTRRIELQGVWDSIVSTTNSTTGTTREGRVTLNAIFRGPADNLGWLNAGWMTPPRNIVVRKRDSTTVETGAIDSAAPTLVWNEPISGLPNTYIVGFSEMTVDPTDDKKLVFKRLPQLIRTRNTEAHVPPGILKLDTNYVFTVLATDCFTTMPERPTRPTRQSICGLADNRSRVMFTPQQ